jgi:hypothetical protein
VSLAQRLQRVELAHRDRLLRVRAGRLAEEHGVSVDQVLQELQEITQRVQRWGIDYEISSFAKEAGLSEDEVRRMFDEERQKIEAEEAITIEG